MNDASGLNCFLRGPEFQFQCYQGARGFSVFSLTRGLDGKTYLTINGSIDLHTCSAGASVPPPAPSNADPTQDVCYDIFSPDTSGAQPRRRYIPSVLESQDSVGRHSL